MSALQKAIESGNNIEAKLSAFRKARAKKEAALKRLMKMQEKKQKEAAKTGAGPAAPAPVEMERWKTLTDPVMSWHAKPYDQYRVFKAGQFILHKKEGMGHVESADEEEIIVLFKGGLHRLAHNQVREE